MIVHSFSFDHGDENNWYNIFIEPLNIDENIMYLVGLTKAGEGIPPHEKLQEIALTAETVSPVEEAISLPALCSFIESAMQAGTWETPFLISENLLEISAPTSAFEEGQSDAARGLHYNANPYAEHTVEFDQWDEGWTRGYRGNFDDLKH